MITLQEKKDIFQYLYDTIYSIKPTGGDLHVILEDGNLEDRSIKFCMKRVVENRNNPDWLKHMYMAALDMLQEVREDERFYLIYGFMEIDKK